MKIRRKIILLLACVFTAALGAFVLASCSLENITIDDLIERGYAYTVTFDFRGGVSNNQTVRVIQVKENSLVPEPGTVAGTGLATYEAPTRDGYALGGYCLAKLDENGETVYDDDGNVVMGEEWNFATDRVNSNLTLYAYWLENYKLILHYGEDYSLTKEVEVKQDANGNPLSITAASAKLTGYTVIGGYFTDSSLSEESKITFPYTPSADVFADGNLEFDVWVDAIEGTYTVISDPKDLINFYSNGANIYLLNDVDMTGVEVSFPDAYSGKFVGNGHTISNLTISQTITGRTGYCGLFKQIASGAEITDVTFENVTLNVTLDNRTIVDYGVGLFAGSIASGATLKNVTVSGTLNYSVHSSIVDKGDIAAFIPEHNIATGAVFENCDYTEIKLINVGE